MTYFDNATAMTFKLDIWAEPRPPKSHEREAELAAEQSSASRAITKQKKAAEPSKDKNLSPPLLSHP